MQGKNCFRTRWTQEPIFSGGNIASLALPRRSFDSLRSAADAGKNGTAVSALPDFAECLVMACGDTINVVLAATGEAVCSYTLPVEDVILTLDAVSVLSEDQQAPFGQRALTKKGDAAASESTTAAGGKKKLAKKAEVKVEESAAAEEASPADDEANPELVVPMGCYIACGTQALQLYLLSVTITETVPLRAEKLDGEEEGGKAAANAHAVEAALAPVISYGVRVVRNWTASQQAISIVSFSNGGQFLISGSTDGGIKVWNAFHHHLTHNFRCPSNSLLQTIYLDVTETYLISGAFEGHITVFDFVEKVVLAHSRPHVQAVDAIALSEDGSHVLSIARDRRLSIQALRSNGLQGRRRGWELAEERAIVVKEHLSAAVFEDPRTLHIGSMDGILTTYHVDPSGAGPAVTVVCRNEKPPASKAEDLNEETMMKCILVCGRPKGSVRSPWMRGFRVEDTTSGARSPLYVADAGSNIARMSYRKEANQYVCDGTLVGFLDQILDVKTFPDSFPYKRVVVNNSKDVRLYDTNGCFSGQVLQGHAEVVMCCAVNSDATLIATGGKDTEVRFWSSKTWKTVALGVKGHTGEITSMCFNAKQTDSYCLLLTISADENLRLWDVGQNVLPCLGRTTGAVVEFENRAGVNAAHTGPVFAVAVAPNDQFVATGGKDKVINLWNVSGKKIYKDATLKGHRRGIAALAFSPTDRVLASAANDGSVRLWSLISNTCVKSLQVDKVAVLQLAFFNSGTQLVTGNAEGVLRVWAVAASECVWVAEAHTEKVWALTVDERHGQTMFLSGAANGVIIATEDYTAEEVERIKTDRHDVILKEQALANAMRRGEFTDAFMLALQLNHPRHLRQVLVRWCAVDSAQCEESMKTELLPKLTEEHTLRLLQFTREWITNSRHCVVASLVIFCFLGAQHFQDLAEMPAMQTLIEPLLAYSQRHSQRQHDLMRRTYYIDYLTQLSMGGGGAGQRTLTSMPPFIDADGKRIVSGPEPPSKKARVR